MTVSTRLRCRGVAMRCGAALLAVGLLAAAASHADFTLHVTDPDGNPVSGFRWIVEEDNTNQPTPGELVVDSLALDIHKSHAPVLTKGHEAGSSVNILMPDGLYVVSVLPDMDAQGAQRYTMSGTSVTTGQTEATVIVNSAPVPTAQISVFVFEDNWPINNAPDQPEAGLAGFTIVVHDAAGQVMQNVYGSPLTNALSPVETGVKTTAGEPRLGEALIKDLAPGKYGLQIIPPAGEGWIQTSTIEGTRTIDAWIKAGEPRVFVEFGPARHHVFVGFTRQMNLLGSIPNPGGQTGTIKGQIRYNHFNRPPHLLVAGGPDFPGQPVERAWVGLNKALSREGVYTAPAGNDPATGDFTITGVPPGTYILVTWDENLDSIFGFNAVTVPDLTNPLSPNWNIDLGDVLAFRWFGTLEGKVFYDTNLDGFPDENEPGMPEQGVLLRFRDGTVYQATVTDLLGNYSFGEVLPFFKWLVAEVDFLRYRDTGFTNVVDHGGAIPGNVWPAEGKRNPQPQAGGMDYRTESGVTPATSWSRPCTCSWVRTTASTGARPPTGQRRAAASPGSSTTR